MSRFDRRGFLIAAAAALAVPRLWARPAFSGDPFALGIASGAPLPDGVVLWTRLAPDPLNADALPPAAIEVRWEIARDEAFRDIVRHGTTLAEPRFAHSVHVEADGLEPARWYWYRFMAGEAVSPVGRTRTAPAANSPVDRLRFAFASCQQYEQGFYAAHRHMAAEDLDLVVFLGDYIYESSWGSRHVRKHEGPEPYTLAQYRNRYACYKSDPDLQRCHAAFPWLVTWDDHEVDNDYANDRPEDLDPFSSPAAPPPIRPTGSTCRCAAAPCRTDRTCGSTAATTSAGWHASMCWTAASTATTRPARVTDAAAATSSATRPARSACCRSAPCLALRRSAGCARVWPQTARAGTSSPSRC